MWRLLCCDVACALLVCYKTKMSKTTDEEWEQQVAQAKQESQEQLRLEQPRSFNRKLRACLFMTPPAVLLLAFCWPKPLESLAFAVWLGGGLVAFGVLVSYACSNNVSHGAKEAALSFLLGDLVVFGLLLLKPV